MNAIKYSGITIGDQDLKCPADITPPVSMVFGAVVDPYRDAYTG